MHKFSQEVNPDDQALIDKLWKEQCEATTMNSKKKLKQVAIYHPVASPCTFSMAEEEPLRIYGSMYSATKKDGKKRKVTPMHWNSSEDKTPDPTDVHLNVEFSPQLDDINIQDSNAAEVRRGMNFTAQRGQDRQSSMQIVDDESTEMSEQLNLQNPTESNEMITIPDSEDARCMENVANRREYSNLHYSSEERNR